MGAVLHGFWEIHELPLCQGVARGWTLLGWLLPIGLLVAAPYAAHGEVDAPWTPKGSLGPDPKRASTVADATRLTPVGERRVLASAWRATSHEGMVFEPPRPVVDASAPVASDAELRHGDPCDSDVEQLRGEPAVEVFYGPPEHDAVALTFDDGPSRENTGRILAVLDRYDVAATFFVLGHRAQRMPDLVADIDTHGHDVGNHSWSHPSFRSLWQSQIRDELCRTGDAIEAAIDKRPALFRPPFGRYAPSALPTVGGLGYRVVLWSVDSLDWDEDDPATVARTVVRAARPGSIILLHDRASVTVHALPAIIEGLRARDLRIEPVSQLLEVSPYQPVSTPGDDPGTVVTL